MLSKVLGLTDRFSIGTKRPVPPPAKRSRRWVPWAAPALTFLLGIGIGAAPGGSQVTSSPEYVQLRSELKATEDEADQLSSEVDEARAEIEQVTVDAEARIAERVVRLERRSAELERQEKALDTREKALRSVEQQAAAPPPPPAPVPAPAPVVVPEPAPQEPSSAYYDNCDAARAAGAAPVRVGGPGYGRHLDRDGDGVGCE